MHRVVLDRSMQERLPDLADQIELCDEAGRTLGYFLPPDIHHELMYAWAKSQFTDAELETARQELKASGGLTTSELLDRLAELHPASS